MIKENSLHRMSPELSMCTLVRTHKINVIRWLRAKHGGIGRESCHSRGKDRQFFEFSEFLTSQGYTVRVCLKQNQNIGIRGWRDSSALRALVALAEGLSVVTSNHVVAHGHLSVTQISEDSMPSSDLQVHKACM